MHRRRADSGGSQPARRMLARLAVTWRLSYASRELVGREALMALHAGYGEGMALHGADALVVNISQTPGVVILEYEVQGNAVGSGKLYENRFISVVTIEDRKIVGWRDYMDSLAARSSLT